MGGSVGGMGGKGYFFVVEFLPGVEGEPEGLEGVGGVGGMGGSGFSRRLLR